MKYPTLIQENEIAIISEENTILISEKKSPPISQAIVICDKIRRYVLPLNCIVRLESKRIYTIIHLKNREPLIFAKNIKVVFDDLKSDVFFRIHKSHVINLDEVIKYSNGGRVGKVTMSDQEVIDVAARRKKSFLEKVYDHGELSSKTNQAH